MFEHLRRSHGGRLTFQHLRRSRCECHCSVDRDSKFGERRWKVAIGVFVLARVIYSLTFTFSGTIATCQLVFRESRVNYDNVEDVVAAALKAATSQLLRRLAELEQSGTLSSLDDEDTTLRQLHSSVTACSQYVDDLLSTTAVQFAQNYRLNQTFSALDRLQRVHKNFRIDMAEYIHSQKTQLHRVLARPAAEDVKLRREGLLDNDWLRYPRSLFQLAADATSQNVPVASVRSEQFAVFVQGGDELNVIEQWTSAVDKRYNRIIVHLCLFIFFFIDYCNNTLRFKLVLTLVRYQSFYITLHYIAKLDDTSPD